MTNEEIHKDVSEAIKSCYKIICDMAMQYEDKYRWKLAARVVNSLWAVVYKPTMKAIAKETTDGVK
jgi:hypothetical protein